MKDTTFVKIVCIFSIVIAFAAVFMHQDGAVHKDFVPRSAWMSGAPPLGIPVIGFWIYEGEIVTMACQATDYAGLYEFSLIGRGVPPIDTPPDYWTYMPERLP